MTLRNSGAVVAEGGGASTQLKLHKREFEQVCRTMYDSFGIDLEGKEVLVAARLGKKLRELQLPSFESYLEMVRKDASGESLTAMVDVLTTNHTSFFREPKHFDYLRSTILPSLKPTETIRIWSAACSSGEEPYSIAFTLCEALGAGAETRASILATDISTRVLEIAKRGVYEADRFSTMTHDRMRRHLLKGSGNSSGLYMVRKEIRSMVSFHRLNLMEDFTQMEKFQVIFCRNVMIYFDRKTQEALVRRLTDQLEPGGYLLIGHAESLNGVEHDLKYVCPATYRKSTATTSTLRWGRTT